MTQNNQKPKMMVQNISCVLPQQTNLGGLFLGNVYGAQNPLILKQYGIRAVLTSSIQTDINYNFQDVPFHMKIQAHDKQNYNLKQHINKCIDFIEKARQLTNIYIHCFAGVSRSVAIVCAYIMWKLKWNFETTIAFVKAKRIVAKPNQGFIRQLLQIQQILLETSSYITPQSSKLEEYNFNVNPQIFTNSIIPTQPPIYQINNKIEPQIIKKQTVYENRTSNGVSNNLYIEKDSRKSSYTNSTPNYTNPVANPFKVQKDVYLAQRIQNTPQSATTQNQYNYQNYQQIQKNQQTDKFFYLQNFFPQNHIPNKLNQNDSKDLQNNHMTFNDQKYQIQNNQKQRNNNSVTSSSTESWFTNSKNHQKFTSAGQGLKKQQISHGSTKNLTNYQIQKPISSTSQLTLGGKKTNYNHNNIPVPKVSQKKQTQKNCQQLSRASESVAQSNNFYHSQNQSNYHKQRASQDYTGGFVPQINQYMWSPTQKYETHNKFSNQSMKSPTHDSIYNKKYDFRSSAQSDGFYKNRTSAQKIQVQKNTSRVLVRPKDLPGYKNY